MSRPPLEIGKTGKVTVKETGPGKFVARTGYRARDGRRRDVTASGSSIGAAERALAKRIEQFSPKSDVGLSSTMAIEEAVTYWLEHRAHTGSARRRAPLKPQTLAAYGDAARLTVVPALGGVRLREITVGRLDAALVDLDSTGISTAQARSVLSQVFGLAIRHGAMETNPMMYVAPLTREPHEVEALTVSQARALRVAVSPAAMRKPGCRAPGRDLQDLVDGLLATGCRVGEILALRWADVDLDGPEPTAMITGTLVEPRAGFVAQLHRQEATKSGLSRTLILPAAFVEQLTTRRIQARWNEDDHPVFASRNGTYLWPSNMRTRLRAAVESMDDLAGITPHTLRRTVGTLIAHQAGLDAAREQLGHIDPSVTARYYVAARDRAPDVRLVLEQFFETEGCS